MFGQAPGNWGALLSETSSKRRLFHTRGNLLRAAFQRNPGVWWWLLLNAIVPNW
jgi:hypothetical protein